VYVAKTPTCLDVKNGYIGQCAPKTLFLVRVLVKDLHPCTINSGISQSVACRMKRGAESVLVVKHEQRTAVPLP
jgi:hypothetical protein